MVGSATNEGLGTSSTAQAAQGAGGTAGGNVNIQRVCVAFDSYAISLRGYVAITARFEVQFGSLLQVPLQPPRPWHVRVGYGCSLNDQHPSAHWAVAFGGCGPPFCGYGTQSPDSAM
jgi:hypothetical protein